MYMQYSIKAVETLLSTAAPLVKCQNLHGKIVHLTEIKYKNNISKNASTAAFSKDL